MAVDGCSRNPTAILPNLSTVLRRAYNVNVSVDFPRQVEPAAASFFSQLGRRIYVSATSYLDFLNTFLTMLRERRRALSTRLARQVIADNGIVRKCLLDRIIGSNSFRTAPLLCDKLLGDSGVDYCRRGRANTRSACPSIHWFKWFLVFS